MHAVAEGHYARKQLGCRSAIIRWSHAARFRLAVKLAGRQAGGRLLDYGCGDGTFLGLVADRFAACVGTDVDAHQLEDCRSRFRGLPNVHFCLVSELAGAEQARAYAVVTCMETLEHCPEPIVDKVLEDLKRLCAPEGTIVISVPIETGLVFVIKYIVRKLAAWRGLGHYDRYEQYSIRDAWRMVFATGRTIVERPVYGTPEFPFHSHYGFNWRRLRQTIDRALDVERTHFTPVGVLGGWFSSQVWFVCRPSRPARAVLRTSHS